METEVKEEKKGTRGDYLIFSSVEFIYRIITSFPNYLTVFLQGLGMSASIVGSIGAINSAIGIVAGPFWGMLSDKIRSVRKIFMLVLVVTAITWGLVPLTIETKLPFFGLTLGFIIIVFNAFFRIPANSLADSWVIQSVNRRHLVYGSVRIWGSIGFAVIGFVLSALMTHGMKAEKTFLFYTITCLLLAGFAFFIKDKGAPQDVKKKTSLKEMQLGSLFKNYYFVTYLIFAVFLYIPTNGLTPFLPYLMEEVHVSTDLYGLIVGYRALLEVPILISIVKLRKRFSLPQLMMTAAGIYAIECFTYSFIDGFWPFMIMQTLHGVAGGTFIACGIVYIFSLAPAHLKATAQTVYGSINATAGIIGNLLGGFLLDSIGVRKLYVFASAILVFAVGYFITTLIIGKKVSSQPSPLSAKL